MRKREFFYALFAHIFQIFSKKKQKTKKTKKKVGAIKKNLTVETWRENSTPKFCKLQE